MTSTIQHRPVAPRWRRLDARHLDAALLGGLAGVFLVNALVAFVQPADFTGLVARSLLGRWWPALAGDWMAWLIGVNDAVLGVALLAAIGIRRARPVVLAWAGLWFLAVTAIKVTSLQLLGG